MTSIFLLKRISPVVLLVFTVSCYQATEPLNIGSSNIRVTSGRIEPHCKFIQQISVSSNAAPGWGKNPSEELHNKLRNRAADLGGDFVRIDSMGLNPMAGGSALGSVYKCS